jgi:hypothetical protein
MGRLLIQSRYFFYTSLFGFRADKNSGEISNFRLATTADNRQTKTDFQPGFSSYHKSVLTVRAAGKSWNLTPNASMDSNILNKVHFCRLKRRALKLLTKREKALVFVSYCGCGGTGRRAGFRCLWALARGGSTPLIRIKPP